jgi:hypothetical protein
LYGFEIRCACYSEYLSRRDYLSFDPMFMALDVQLSIRYGTFNVICENLMNEQGDIRELALSKINE